MTDNRLHKLRRPELLQMLLELEEENERLSVQNRDLEQRNAVLREQLAHQEELVRRAGTLAGTLADASRQMGAVFAAAKDAAELYFRQAETPAAMPGTTGAMPGTTGTAFSTGSGDAEAPFPPASPASAQDSIGRPVDPEAPLASPAPQTPGNGPADGGDAS